jgi:hypothetical protein
VVPPGAADRRGWRGPTGMRPAALGLGLWLTWDVVSFSSGSLGQAGTATQNPLSDLWVLGG